MKFLLLIVVVVVLCTLFSNSYALETENEEFSSAEEIQALRAAESQDAVDTEGWVVKDSGFYEAVYYTGGKKKKGCIDPIMKVNYKSDKCSPSQEQPGSFVRAWTYADAQANVLYAYNQFFSDPSCDTALGDPALYFQRPILICQQPAPSSSGFELAHMISAPRNPATDQLGVALLVYDTQSNCQANNYKVGVLESLYARPNRCYKDAKGDFKYSGCSKQSLTITTYSSTDGSCKGTAKPFVLNSETACSSGDVSVAGAYQGWQSWGCSSNPL